MSRRRDLVIASATWACAIAVLALVPALAPAEDGATIPDAGSTGWWAAATAVAVQAVLLTAAARSPRAVLLATASVAPLAALAGADDATGLTLLAVVVATYRAATAIPLRDLGPALAGATALVIAGGVISGLAVDSPLAQVVGGSVLQAVGTLGLTLLVATWVASRREATRAREERALALEREQQALVQAAIARERTAMARELHDIAAHHLSGIAVMAAAIGTQVDTDPDGAKDAAQQVRRQSTAVLRDLRRLVGLLREDDPADGVRPETLAGISALVGEAAASDVTLTVLGGDAPTGHGVGPLAQLAAFRMAQEALANAMQHAPGAAVRVVIDERADDAVLVTVANAASTRPVSAGGRSGFGLVGMHERAELTGADLEVGPTPDGGWRVALRIPRDALEEER